MQQEKLVEIRLHGALGESVGKKYRLSVKSVGEAIHAINCIGDNKLYKFLHENNAKGLQYDVVVNSERVDIPEETQRELTENPVDCELSMPRGDLETIDIVPVLEGGDKGTIALVAGALLIAVGIVFSLTGFGTAFAPFLIGAGIGLLGAGIVFLLATPPKFQDFRTGGRGYLFDGPENVTGEGGPVPLLYGRLIVGSQVVSAHNWTELREPGHDGGASGSEYLQVNDGGKFQYLNGVSEQLATYHGAFAVASITHAVIYDLISEGEIEGLVAGSYVYQGTAGKVGYDSYRFNHYVNAGSIPGWARSVIFNGVPAIDPAGQANFQDVDLTYSLGTEDGNLLTSSSTNTAGGDGTEIRVTRLVGERLYGGAVNQKLYRFYNVGLKAFSVTFRFPQMYRPNDNGTLRQLDSNNDHPNINIYYRPLYQYDTLYSASSAYPGGPVVDLPDSHFGFTRPLTVWGRVTSAPQAYECRIEFAQNNKQSPSFVGYEIGIRRFDIDLGAGAADPVILDSITEIYEHAYAFPNSAVIRNGFRADYYSSIPNRAYDLKGIKVKIPSNFDPIKHSYSAQISDTDGTSQEWDGTFAENKAWTDNPAWIFYDLLTSKRYGLGRWISEDQVDKWTLYMIGKYCDTLVADGYGGLEPRFTCNAYITTREQAIKVLNDFASVFNAIVYYGFGFLQVVQDCPKTPYIQFTNANVEEGNFVYSNTSKRVRHTTSLVRYSDPKNFFKPTVEYVENLAGIQRYGFRQLDLTAFGCSSRGQAVRLARWALLSETLETETVSFTAGMEAATLRPGDVFKVYDQNKKTSNYAGRILSFDAGNQVTLDRSLSLSAGVNYQFSLLAPSYIYDVDTVNTQGVKFMAPRDVSGIRNPQIQQLTFTSANAGTNNGNTQITFSTNLDASNFTLAENPVWLIENLDSNNSLTQIQTFTDQNFDYYRCVRIEEKEELKYEVVGLQYVSGKFALVENGLNFERAIFDYGVIPATPTSFFVNSLPGSSRYRAEYSFVAPNLSGVSSFAVFASRVGFTGTGYPDQSYLVDHIPYYQRKGSFFPDSTGFYEFRVYAYNDYSKVSSSGFISGSVFVEAPTDPIEGTFVASLQVQNVTGDFTPDVPLIISDEVNPVFSWQIGAQGSLLNLRDLRSRLTFRQPTTGLIPSPKIFKQVIDIPSSGALGGYVFDFEQNKNIPGGPFRTYSVVVEAYSPTGNIWFTSAGNQFLGITGENGWLTHKYGYASLMYHNPPISGITLTSGGYITGNYITTGLIDPIGGVRINFLSGTLSSGIMGGILYSSTGVFDPQVAKTGNVATRTEFGFDNNNLITKSFYVPNVFQDFRIRSGFVAVSFYDRFDKEFKAYNSAFYTGLDVSNTVPISRMGGMSDLYITSKIQMQDFNRNENYGQFKVSGNGTNFSLIWIDNSGNSWTASSYTGA